MTYLASINFFTLLRLQRELRAWDYDKLDLINLDRLRDEIAIKIESINRQETQMKNKDYAI